MNAQEKKQFIEALTDTIVNKLAANVDQMPDEWDGAELRQLLADKFTEANSIKMAGKRMRNYRNTVMNNNL